MLSVLRAVLRVIVSIGVVFYTLLDELLFPLFRPLVRWLSGLKLFEAVGALIRRLPPYGVLVLLGVPFVIIEPAKVLALVWMAEGKLALGIALLVGAQVLSIFTCDRIYHTGHAQLMRIGWFKRLMGWLKGLRDRVLDWVRATPAWAWARALAGRVRRWFTEIRKGV